MYGWKYLVLINKDNLHTFSEDEGGSSEDLTIYIPLVKMKGAAVRI